MRVAALLFISVFVFPSLSMSYSTYYICTYAESTGNRKDLILHFDSSIVGYLVSKDNDNLSFTMLHALDTIPATIVFNEMKFNAFVTRQGNASNATIAGFIDRTYITVLRIDDFKPDMPFFMYDTFGKTVTGTCRCT